MSLVPFAARTTLSRLAQNPAVRRAVGNAARNAVRHVVTNMPRYMTRYQKKRAAMLRRRQSFTSRSQHNSRVSGRRRQSSSQSSYVRNRRSIGFRRNEGATKRTETTYTPDELETRTLHITHLTSIPKTASNEIDSRQRNQIFISGMKFCIELRNNTDECLVCNMALVCPKNKRILDASNSAPNEQWFRGTGEDRGLDFTTALSSSDLHCRPINTDEHFVLMHKRFDLAPKQFGSGAVSSIRPNYRFFNFYKHIKRSFRWNSDGQSYPVAHPIYLVMWCDKAFSAEDTDKTDNVLTCFKRVITYFKEPNN